MSKSQNFITEGYFKAKNDNQDFDKILAEISKKSGFISEKLINKSEWWGSGRVGAIHYLGNLNQEKSVLKIQLIKPNISEIDLINNFEKSNRSKIVRPPKLLFSIPWDDKSQYEAFIIEDVGQKKLSSSLENLADVDKFFNLYQEYKQNCVSKPWLEKPTYSISESTQKRFNRWKKISAEIYPDHPFKTSENLALIDEVVELLVKKYEEVEWEFQHGHFSPSDLFEKNGQYILLSNLYWSWRAPYYDAVFAYQWQIFHLANLPGISEEKIKKHSDYWLEKIWALVSNKPPKDQDLLRLALLERTAAGLNLDVYTVEDKHIEYVLGLTAERVRKLMK